MESCHGGDREGFVRRYGRAPLDFSANVSPLGLPAPVRRAVVQALPQADAYPDPFCRRLCEKIAAARGLLPGQILCGNGAAELIFRLALALRPQTALLPAPTFSEYEAALTAVGCTVRRWPLKAENGFALGEDFLQAVQPGVQLVMLCQPNNPTGVPVPRRLLVRLARRCARVGAVLCVDECFADFLPRPGDYTLARQLSALPHVILLRAFTKLYGMAGLRLGWCECADPALLERMRAAGQPWAVGSLAQAAGLAALDCRGYVRRVRALVAEQRPRMQQELRELGFAVTPSSANFILFDTGDPDLGQRAARAGLLLRDCRNYPGLAPGWYRTAVRTAQENAQMLQILKEAAHGKA